MKKCTICKEYLPFTEFQKDRSRGDGLQARCKACGKKLNQARDKLKHAETVKSWNDKNKDRIKAVSKIYKEKNRDKILKRNKDYYLENRQELLEKDKIRYCKNKKKRKKYHKEWYQKNKDRRTKQIEAWRLNNSEKVVAKRANRRATKKNAMPPWVDKEEIRKIYNLRDRITKETGIEHHVDHIIPLRGKGVRGLHVPWNLQIIPASENLSKGNSYEPQDQSGPNRTSKKQKKGGNMA